MPVKEDVVRVIRESLRDIEGFASSLPEAAWSTGVYESGWNAKQLLCHLAGEGIFASLMISFAKAPPSPDTLASFDQDAWNAAQVASRQAKSLAELLDELRSNCERSIAAVEAAPDELLSAHFRAPWDAEGPQGPLADVIIEALQDHVRTHLAELREAIA